MNLLEEYKDLYYNSNGQPIQIVVPQPEYITEIFNMHSNINNNSTIFTGDDE